MKHPAYFPAVFGNFGEILHVELRGHRVDATRIALPESVYRDFIGGVGLGVYLLWRFAPAGVAPLSREAPLIYSFGPLLGSPLTTTAKFAVVCKSPLTQRINDGLSSSRFALAAKRLGVDAIVISGALDALSVLHLDSLPSRCRAEPCPNFRGATAADVAAVLAGAGHPHCAAIGPAGEALVVFATLSNDGRHAGRGGAGAVLGSKRVKAITVRGDAVARVAEPDNVRAAARDLAVRSRGISTDKYRLLGTASNLETFDRLQILPTRNFQVASIGRQAAKRLAPSGLAATAGHTRESCAACTIGCDHRYGGVRMEYETLFALGPLCGGEDPAAVLQAAAACDALGLDTISAGGTIAFAMECRERGLVDWPLQFGDPLAPVLAAIASRDGFAELLAAGSRAAAAEVGQGCADFACHVKGLELPGYEPRALPTMALGLCVASRGADHNRSGAYQADLRAGVDRQHPDVDALPLQVIASEDAATLLDTLVFCKFLRGAITDPLRESAELLRFVTGFATTADTLAQAVRCIAEVRHAFNRREGWTIAEDRLPERFYTEALAQAPPLSRASLSAQVAAYHAARGRGPEGTAPVPRESLCGLEVV